MSDEFKKIIEINGIKIEVDLRTAKRIENYKVGDGVKLLVKEYGDTFKSYPGVIVGFDEFQNRPTIVVAYVVSSYSSVEMKFAYINKDSKDHELATLQDYETKLSFAEIQKKFDKDIHDAEAALKKKIAEKEWFNSNYHTYFGKMFKEFGQDVTEGQG
jgi:hypothetical protein